MTLKVRLLLGAAAPLVLTLPAIAQVSISTATTTPVRTATANAGTASDVRITSSGSITLDKQNGATAVTIDSNNSLENNGAVTVTNSDNAVGVRILAGRTGDYKGSGTISVTEDYTRPDTDNDGDQDGPLAIGSGRIGLLLEAGGSFNGNILLQRGATTSAAVTVEGNDSYGISLRSALNGNYIQDGSVSVTGSNSVALDIREGVTGNIDIGGVTNAQGENSVGVRIAGAVAGEFMIDGAIIATGFTSRERSNYDPNLKDNITPPVLDADDLLIGGAAVEIRRNLARGFLINGNAVGGADPTPNVKDVVQNFNENRTQGTVSSFGSAPAVLIQSSNGTAGGALQLGLVEETIYDSLDDDKDSDFSEVIGKFVYEYGLMNRGSILSTGLNVGVSSTALRISGSADGLHSTAVAGGIFNGGTISARSFESNAIAVQIGAGASTPKLVNGGSIQTSAATRTNHTAHGILIETGANVNAVVNNGLILSDVRGYGGDSVAFRDRSGSVTSFTNSSRISAIHTDDDLTDAVTSGSGLEIALDFSTNATGVTLTQTDTVDNARILGDVRFGSGNDIFNLLSGELQGDVFFGTGSDTFAINSAAMTGDTTFRGSGASLSMAGGTLSGKLDFGSAVASMLLTDGSRFDGDILRTGTAPFAMTVNNSTLNNYASGALNLSSMSLANAAKVGLVIDNARIAGNIPIFNVTGTATIAANTQFTPIFRQFTNRPFTLRVLQASTLNLAGPVSSMLNANSPYLYTMRLVQPTANAIDLTLDVKSTTQLDLNTRQASAYNGVLDLLTQSDEFAVALTSLTDGASFKRGWGDLLPASDAAIMRVLASNATAAFGATAHRLDLISNKPNAPGGAWAEEFGVFHRSDATEKTVEVSGGGFGVAAGIDLISNGEALVGTFLSLESVEMEEENRSSAPLNVSHTSAGAYGGWIAGNLTVNGAASIGLVDFTSDRRVVVGDLNDRVRGQWKGNTYTGAVRATYRAPLGWFDAKAFIAADHIGFSQEGYKETATELEDLALDVADSEASLTTASYGVVLEADLSSGDAFSFRPHASVGYRHVLNWDSAPGKMRFAGGSAAASFALEPGVEPEDAVVAGLGIDIDSQFVNIRLGYDAEVAENALTHYGSVTFRMAFW